MRVYFVFTLCRKVRCLSYVRYRMMVKYPFAFSCNRITINFVLFMWFFVYNSIFIEYSFVASSSSSYNHHHYSIFCWALSEHFFYTHIILEELSSIVQVDNELHIIFIYCTQEKKNYFVFRYKNTYIQKQNTYSTILRVSGVVIFQMKTTTKAL